MRSETVIRDKLKDLRFKTRLRFLKENLSVRPCNCVHNHVDRDIQLCMLGADDPENWPGNICDTDEIATSCPFFKCKNDPDSLKAKFRTTIEPDHSEIQLLMWALELESYEDDYTWWQRLKTWWGS